jgi:methyltransferase (TIGR00027 family)
VWRHPLAVDVTGPWAAAIVARGFRPATPTMWVVEGLLPYLSATDQRGVLDDIVALSAPGSRIVLERAVAIEDSPEARERLETFGRMTGLPIDDVLARTDPPDPALVLRGAGWSADTVTIDALSTRYGRKVALDGNPAAPSRGGFVTAGLR